MEFEEIALLVLVVLFLGAFPVWPYSRRWGYVPSGALGLLVLLVILKMMI
jgi:hypothetical protein